MPLKFLHGLRQDFLTRNAKDEHINVACRILLVPGKRTVQICLLDSLDFAEGLPDYSYRPDRFLNDLLDFGEKRILTIQMKILLAATDF